MRRLLGAPLPGLHEAVRDLGFERLAITDAHLLALEALPLLHRDPFDRLLIGQASVERLMILPADAVFAGYGVPVLDARA